MSTLNPEVTAALTAGRLAHLGDDQDNPPPGHVVRITAERVGGAGPWTENS